MKRRLSWRGPPLSLQIAALLLGGLIVAQLVTLLLTVVLPPAPKPQYGLDDIAAALADRRGTSRADGALERHVRRGPPDVSGAGWLVSETSRHDLALLLGARDAEVALAFYTPLPFAGTTAARPVAALANDGPSAPLAPARLRPAAFVLLQPPGGDMAPPPAMPPPQVLPPQPPAEARLPRVSSPPGMLPDGDFARGARGAGHDRALIRDVPHVETSGRAPTGSTLYTIDPRPAQTGPGGTFIPGDGGAAVPPLLNGGRAATPAVSAPLAATTQTAPAVEAPPLPPLNERARRVGELPLLPRLAIPGRELFAIPPAPPRLAPMPRPAPPPARAAAPEAAIPRIEAVPLPATLLPYAAAPPPPAAAAPIAPSPAAAAPAVVAPDGPPIAIAPAARGLFGFAPAPFVVGDFVAALRLPDGRWSVVQPAAEPFPNAWQRRVLLWFALAFAIVAPLGWLFARRLVTPLGRFAYAAEQLGRDPSAAILPLAGPAEIGRAANAFNLMQSRLRSFVEDRTAMIGAISHDLRTPLTRMRFRIEDTDGEVREGMLEEVDAMEAMITQVIAFIRDASVPGVRERLDLGTLVDEAVEDAQLVGRDVTIERGDPGAAAIPVEVDVLGIRRVLDNLLENAVKYGTRARVRLTTDVDTALAEIVDDGPGLPDDELERAFEPFYRGETARASDKAGSGLGLAVCRSIARAHGGDVRLLHARDGFAAQVRLPLAYDAERPLAA